MKTTFYVLVLLLMPASYGFAEETVHEKVQKILNNKAIEDPYVRWKTAYDTTANYYNRLSFEEGILLYNDILLPFIDKEVKNSNQNNHAKADIYRRISLVYQYKGDAESMETAEIFQKKGVQHAEKSGNDTLTAFFYEQYAHLQSLMGNTQVALDYIYMAIKLYESINQYDKVSQCLYRIGIELLHIRDITGLRKVIEQMKSNIERESSVGALYYLYSVQGAYYNTLSDDYPDLAFNDSALWVSRKLINLIENHRAELPKVAAIVYNYMNMALLYEKKHPDDYDSIYYFLNKTLESKPPRNKNVNTVIDIKVYTLYAQLRFKQNRYEESEKDMLYVLSLLEQMDDHQVVVELSEAYRFLTLYYETVNRPVEALKYHKLLLENEGKRYNNDKIVAMNDMLAKYETEQKEEQIDRLTEQNRAAQKILTLTICLIAVLLIALLFFIRLYRLRRKHLKQTVYESALLAEMKQTELEQNQKEKECLQQQYDTLEAQVKQNKQKAEPHIAELERLKQQLEQKLTKTLIGKLSELISKSVIEKSKKDLYLHQLSELDVDVLEQGYLSAEEKISTMDMKYIVCFAIEMDVKDMSLLFNVEPGSIRTVRYRIKKKFGEKNTFRFLI
ncbi:MAG: hypothetical protein FWF09_00950 [Bacteroidales bacterium]|nr:hypothetical protein [Bacteroidales bacterium]